MKNSYQLTQQLSITGFLTFINFVVGLEENNMKRFEMSPDGKYIAFLGAYGHIHLLSAHVGTFTYTWCITDTIIKYFSRRTRTQCNKHRELVP